MARNSWKIALVFGALLLLAACSGGAPTAQPTAPAQPTQAQPSPQPTQPAVSTVPDDLKPLAQPYKIKVAVVNNLFGTTFWSAIEKGFFQKHGIQAQAGAYSSGQEAAKALA